MATISSVSAASTAPGGNIHHGWRAAFVLSAVAAQHSWPHSGRRVSATPVPGTAVSPPDDASVWEPGQAAAAFPVCNPAGMQGCAAAGAAEQRRWRGWRWEELLKGANGEARTCDDKRAPGSGVDERGNRGESYCCDPTGASGRGRGVGGGDLGGGGGDGSGGFTHARQQKCFGSGSVGEDGPPLPNAPRGSDSFGWNRAAPAPTAGGGDARCEAGSWETAVGGSHSPLSYKAERRGGGARLESRQRKGRKGQRNNEQPRQEQLQQGEDNQRSTERTARFSTSGCSECGRAIEAHPAYIVQWADYHPLAVHQGLLARSLVGYDRCSEIVGGVSHGVHGEGGGGFWAGVGVDGVGDCSSSGGSSGSRGGSSSRGSSGSNNSSGGGCGGNENASGKTTRHADANDGDEDEDFDGGCGCCWEMVERINAATTGEHPSDFSLIRWLPSGDGTPERLVSLAQVCRGQHGEDTGPPRPGEGGRPEGPAFELKGAGCVEGAGRRETASGESGRGQDSRRGASCVEAVAGRAAGALRRNPRVKSVHREQALTRAVSALPANKADAQEEGYKEVEQEQQSEQQQQQQDNNEKADTITQRPEGPCAAAAGARRHLDSGGGGDISAGPGGAGERIPRSSTRREFVNPSKEGEPLHDQGFKGAGVRVAVFDSGLDAGGHDFGNVVERINWTNEDTLDDRVGHGTHIAGVIGGRDMGCSGLAPDADLYIFRVFSSEQVSYTSWFLDAFNYALFSGIDVVNLSIGGPDFKDQPFVDKVRELSANGVVVVSAVGNDGPLYGTQHNPADQMDTIGVGAVSANGRGVANFQSRGMTTWELPSGYGRVKPDIITIGQHVLGPTAGGAFGQCSGLSGTSVASPVVAGAVALLASTVPRSKRRDIVNPASIKQVLTESARRVVSAGAFEQGAGIVDIIGAHQLLSRYTPRASLLPPELDLTDPYMWPFSRQPLYYSGQPVMFNVTVANGMGVTGYIASLRWVEERGADGAAWEKGGAAGDGYDVLDVRAEFSEVLWPWSGFLAISLSVSEYGRFFQGLARGTLEVTVESEAGPGEDHPRITTTYLPITASVIRTPARHRRLLWDQFHSLPYPSAYSPRDYLGDESDMLDRLGDHPHTNFRTLFQALLDAGYYVEILGSDWVCFDAENYGALLVVDSEADLHREEKAKLEADVKERGLSLVFFADWYSMDAMRQVRFVDDNTRMPWTPVTGGANVPAINDFLLPAFGMALGGTLLDGVFSLPGGEVHLASGNAVSRMPPGGLLISAAASSGGVLRTAQGAEGSPRGGYADIPLIGALDTNGVSEEGYGTDDVGAGGGRIFLFGDSSCADDAALDLLKTNTRDYGDCLWLFKSAVRYACEGFEDPGVFRDARRVPLTKGWGGSDDGVELSGYADGRLDGSGYSDGLALPERPGSPRLQEEGTSDGEGRCGLSRFRRVSGTATEGR